jgi:hypothetical protein
MKSPTFSTIILLSLLIIVPVKLSAQQQVDVSSLEESYKGGFSRFNIGITPLNFSMTISENAEKESYSLVPISFDIIFGRRINRSVAPYFRIGGHVLVKETSNFESFSQAGLNLGLNIYYRDPNTYIAPEIGLAVVNYGYKIYDNLQLVDSRDFSNIGVDLGLRGGRDWHVSGKFFIGTQLYLAYFYSREMELTYPKGSGFFYGVNLSFKFGK